jgi:hypothetical protein
MIIKYCHMKRAIYLLISVVILSSCGSSKKMMQTGNYDSAINKSVKQLRKNPDSPKDAEILDRAYRLANEQDQERVRFLERENNPNNYDEVFAIYSRLKNRQSQVRTVLPINVAGRQVNYEYVDYDAQIIKAKRIAAEYYYGSGQELMKTGTKDAYRQAYIEMSKAQEYSGGMYPELNDLIEEARFKGISRVLVRVNNLTHLKLDPVFEQDLLEFDTRNLETEWVEYHFKNLNEDIAYDYDVLVNLEMISVSPDELKEKDELYKKKVEDGFEYVLDGSGNVMKDTAGNDIKLPKYKTLQCTMIETHQLKSVRIDGNVEILSNNPKKLIRKEPIGAEHIFDHSSARAVGDVDALDDEALGMIEREAIPFPSDFEMIFNCTETLKPAIRQGIYKNRQFIY